ncbi:MAG: iron-siderophore ABC transporter substrate-binding protein [Thermomicrobiales bacterium]|nr:iron-siderophore ABC transporter substrate-binding protein [Thermomicrobiales bacterium]
MNRATGRHILSAALALSILLGASMLAAVSVQAQEATPATLAGAARLPPDLVPTAFGEIPIPGSAERIVTLTDGALDTVIALGSTPVGATTSSNFETPAAYIVDQVPDGITYVGGWGELDLEAIVTLDPDVILTDRWIAEDIYSALVDIAPVIAPLEIDVDGPEALQQWEYEALVWAHALGKDAEALTAIEAVRERAATLAADHPEFNGQSVVVFRPQPNFPVIMSHHWITGVVLTWAGFTGNDLTAELAPPHSGDSISLEELQLLDADWLFAAARDQEQRDALLQIYEENPLFQFLPAAQNGQVVEVSGDLWSGATGILASHAMLDEIESIIFGGSAATPTA